MNKVKGITSTKFMKAKERMKLKKKTPPTGEEILQDEATKASEKEALYLVQWRDL